MEDHSLNQRRWRRAGRPLPVVAAMLLALALAGGGCRKKPPETAADPPPRGGKAQPAALAVPPEGLPAWGRKEILAVGDPALKRACVRVKQRYLWIDRVEVMPASVAAGSELNHRFVYTFCPEGPVAQLKGTLTTRVLRDGRALMVDTAPGYVLTPGQWAVDSRLTIPKAVDPGRYSLETSFEAGGAFFTRASAFTVN